MSAPPPDRSGSDRVRKFQRYLPWPLVGVAVLLVVLIFLTPVLLSASGPAAAGTILTQAQLKVDVPPGSNVIHFYVNAEGATVRYASIVITWATGFAWSGTGVPDWSALDWVSATNQTQVLSAIVSTVENPVALNVTVLYNANGVAYYVGVFAFYVTNATGTNPNSLLAVTSTGGVTLPPTTALASLPLVVSLADVGSGGP